MVRCGTTRVSSDLTYMLFTHLHGVRAGGGCGRAGGRASDSEDDMHVTSQHTSVISVFIYDSFCNTHITTT